MFSLIGDLVDEILMDVLIIAVRLMLYFRLLFVIRSFITNVQGARYKENVAVSHTSAENNFELAIALATASVGLVIGRSVAGVVGPLVEVLVLIFLVRVSFWLKKKYYPDESIRCHNKEKESQWVTLYKRNAGFIAKLNISPRNKNSYKMKVSSSKTRTTLILDR